MKSVFTLDLATRCGWAYWDDSLSVPESGVEVFETARKRGIRNKDARDWLRRMLDYYRPECLFKEAPVVGGAAAQTSWMMMKGYLHGMAEEVAAGFNISLDEADPMPSAWRKIVFGYGIIKGKNASAEWKRRAIAKCDELGWPVKSHDAAEAMLLAHAFRLRTDKTYAIRDTPLLRQVSP